MFQLSGYKNVKEVIDVMRPCTVTYTSHTVYIESEMGKVMCSSGGGTRFMGNQLGFIKKFRNYYEKNADDIYIEPKWLRWKTKYFRFYETKGTFKNMVELDINSAYPNAGRILGIIPDDLFQKGLNYSKLTFLAAIGSLNRRRKVISVDEEGNRFIVKIEQRDDRLANFWKAIVAYTDYAVTKSVENNGGACFFWCDAVFVEKDKAEGIARSLEQYGFTVKSKPVSEIKFKDGAAWVMRDDYDKPKEYKMPVVRENNKTHNQILNRYAEKTRKN